MPHPSLLGIPVEVLGRIVIFAVWDTLVGPPKPLLSLLLTCRTLYDTLSSHGQLYAAIFHQKFDSDAVARHIGRETVNEFAKLELPRRFYALKRLRRGQLDDPELEETFMVVLLMLLENDGVNHVQLQWAGARQVIHRYIREQIPMSGDNSGWPADNHLIALVLSIAWLNTDYATLRNESDHEGRALLRALIPYLFAAFRYSFSMLPETFFPLDFGNLGGSASKAMYTSTPSKQITYFGHEISLRKVPIAFSAILLYFTRIGKFRLGVPPHLPATRELAQHQGIEGPTQQDVEEFNQHPRFHLLTFPNSKQTPSQDRDPYWRFLVVPRDSLTVTPPERPPAYTTGALAGHWRGSSITPVFSTYHRWILNPGLLSVSADWGPRPMYFTLREHFCYSPATPVPLDLEKNGMMNAWLSQGCQWVECEDGIEIFDEKMGYHCFYETYRPETLSPADRAKKYRGVVDVIVTGKTDERRGWAWGSHTFLGRIRLTDGLVVLRRKPTIMIPEDGENVLLRGYVVRSGNFAGRWKYIAIGDKAADIESCFLVCKSDEP